MNIFIGPAFEAHFRREPLTLVDIGARGGLQPNWRQAREHLRVIAFEPDPEEHARLTRVADPRAVHINAAVYREPATLTLNLGRNAGTSSIYQPNFEFLSRFPEAHRFEVVQTVEVHADALDSLLSAHSVGDVDFIKIDTQGAEFPILEGARRTLDESATGLEVEVQFAPLYKGQSRFGQVDDFLQARGFELMDLRPANWKRAVGVGFGRAKGQLVFADALYFRSPASLTAVLAELENPQSRQAKLLRALAVCLIYGYVDYALELFELNRALFDEARAAGISNALRSHVPLSARIPHFRGKGTLSNFFYRLSRMLHPSVGGWATGGRHLGNLD